MRPGLGQLPDVLAPACPSGSWGAAKQGWEPSRWRPVKSHAGKAIRGAGRGARPSPGQFQRKAWPSLAWVSMSLWGPLPSQSALLLKLPPPLHQEAFPLSRNVSFRGRMAIVPSPGKRPPSPSFLASCFWFPSPTTEQPRLSAHLRACLPSDWPPLPTPVPFLSPSQLALASLLSPLQSPQTPCGEASHLGPPSDLPGLLCLPFSPFLLCPSWDVLAQGLYEKTRSQLPHECPWLSLVAAPGTQTTESPVTHQGPRERSPKGDLGSVPSPRLTWSPACSPAHLPEELG